MDYYSSWGPAWRSCNLKPQISSPGGRVLSTWPLGPLGGYAILSGTSMATPYIAASYALVKSVFPTATIEQIKDRLQANENPVPWIYNKTQIASTAQQGAGLVNVYNAIFSQSTISPSQLLVSDVSKTVYRAVNITIQNLSPGSKTYALAHEGAGYSDYYLAYEESSPLPIYGTAYFPTPPITIPAGKTSTISFTINSPASGVNPGNLPVFGGFVGVTDSSNNQQSIPYVGPPYSLYNTPQVLVTEAVGGIGLPEVYALDSSGTVDYNTGLLSITLANGYTGSIATFQ
jgi:subtilisin family serine protease